jgi:hypothetical protein
MNRRSIGDVSEAQQEPLRGFGGLLLGIVATYNLR